MTRSTQLRSGVRRRRWRVLLGCVVALSLMSVRYSVAATSPLSLGHTVRTGFRHCAQKTCFEHDNTPGLAPAGPLPFELAPQCASLAPRSAPAVASQTRGFHYNRPPPAA